MSIYYEEKIMDNNNFYNLFIPLKQTSEIFKDAYIVIDTNVLLMAYQWRDMTFKTVYEALCELSNDGRLKIPHQVIKEFAKNRPEVIQGLYQEIHAKLLSSLQGVSENRQTLNTVVPAFDMIPEVVEPIKNAEENYLRAIKELNKTKSEYKKALQDLQTVVKNLLEHDPISYQFKEIFKTSYMDKIEINENDLKEELKRRKDNAIPPGYKDKGHKGDYIIWQSILSLNEKPVIFVTGDNKADWVYSIEEDVLGARRELIEEFYEKNSETLKILTPLQFIEEYSKRKGQTVDEQIRKDLGKENTLISFEDYFTENLMTNLPPSKIIDTDVYNNHFINKEINTGLKPQAPYPGMYEDNLAREIKEQLESLLAHRFINRITYDKFIDETIEINDLYHAGKITKSMLTKRYQRIQDIIDMF